MTDFILRTPSATPEGRPRVLPQEAGREFSGLRGLQVHRARLAAAILFKLEADALLFQQGLHACPLDGRNMDERVRASVVGRDEAVAFLVVEKLNCADCHIVIPSVPGEPPTGRL